MNDTFVTIVGNVVAEPRHRVTGSGVHVATVRVASTSRKFDRGAGEWRDSNTLFVDVSCWRSLAGNVMASIHKGDAVVVSGRLKMRTYTTEAGEQRTSPQIDASTVGHDLSRGVAQFQKSPSYGSAERRPAAGDGAGTRAIGGGDEGHVQDAAPNETETWPTASSQDEQPGPLSYPTTDPAAHERPDQYADPPLPRSAEQSAAA